MHIKLNCNKETTLKISGTYKLLEKTGKYEEKVYCKLDNSLYIYKVNKTKYVISTRLYSESYRGYITLKKSDTLFSKNIWKIYHGNDLWIKDKILITELNELAKSDIKYTVTEANSQPFSDVVIVYSKYSNIDGAYEKIVHSCNGNIAYYNKEDNIFLYKLRHFFSRYWVIGETLGSYYFYLKSDIFAELPENSSFKSSDIIIKPYVELEIYNNINEKDQFIDTDFDANLFSIGSNEIVKNFKQISWIRASNLQPMFSKMVLFHDVEPNDIIQGCLGDCWLLCALSSIAEFPNYYKTKIFKTKQISKIGKYEINLFDCSKNKWITVTIDDRIPCMKRTIYTPAKPLFSQPHENEMYILLLEKAFAKLAGSYTKLDGGFPSLAWIVLTGCQNIEYWVKEKSYWGKSIIVGNKEEPWNFQKPMGYGTADKSTHENMFLYLKQCDTKNYLMSCAIHGDVMEKKREDGLVERHAYTLLQVYQKNNIKILKIRNPWSTGECNLDWSDNSLKWKEHPDIAQEVKFTSENDGTFWISWQNFLDIFDEVQIACKSLITV